MNLIRRIRDALRRDPPAPRLRNKPGGMAWIKPYGQQYGADAIAGQIVTTVRFEGGFWSIEPTPTYVATINCVFPSGQVLHKGDVCVVLALSDEVLEPIRPVGDGEVSEERTFQPAAPPRAREVV